MAERDAGHDARCEREYTPNGFIFIDCLCSLRSAQAQAWDEAVKGVAWCLDNGEPSSAAALAYTLENNPYRVFPPGQWDDPDPGDPPATKDDDPMWGRVIPPAVADALALGQAEGEAEARRTLADADSARRFGYTRPIPPGTAATDRDERGEQP